LNDRILSAVGVPLWALISMCPATAHADKPFVSIELHAVDKNGEVTPASPVDGIIYLSEQYRSYFASGATGPCELSGAWKSMPKEYRSFGDGNEQGLAYFDSPKSPTKVLFGISCANEEGSTTAMKEWEFLPLPDAPQADTAFGLAEYAPAMRRKDAAKGIAINYTIPGIGSGCLVWRERLHEGEWVPIEGESAFALFSLTEKTGISGSISYSIPPNVSFPYTERFLYSCLNPVLGFYADDKLIGTATYSKPPAAREAVVSIEMPR
jgi:hypothetical protein